MVTPDVQLHHASASQSTSVPYQPQVAVPSHEVQNVPEQEPVL